MRAALLLLTVTSLTACATITAADCRNPYDVAFRDAVFGLQPQENVYAAACRQNGTELNTARYGEGWQEGKYEHDRRTVHGGVD